MRKIGGLLLIGALALTGCSAAETATNQRETPGPTASASASPDAAAQRIAPLLAAPAPAESVAPGFDDESAQAKYLAGVKKVWRGDIPSDEILLKAGGASCTLFAEGKNYNEIASLAGTAEVDVDNAAAAAVYASRTLCTQFNTDR
ncbi:hypothetical protein SAMN04487912_102341 [Arthrobacter sp. cf158]|uniref:hypothetical protein n=1 Tax=Arthrobacter sp. cf158 TaxID=1761744 RepID=UPI00089BF2FD|nr:hypothetical protein [Arthrobacter sp. cf158]SDW32761.1 hypothetical protein SAMN04487912_102341 [Arthrobacter sp. cf158]